MQDDLQAMSERLIELREKQLEIQSAFSLPAWKPSAVPKNRSSGQRRQEDAITALMDVQRRITYLEKCVNEYIDVLREAPVAIKDQARKIRMMELRYFHGYEWPVILEVLYGNEPDFALKRKTYKRKMYRLHQAAITNIWKLWGVGGRYAKKLSRKQE